jgi:hypothetical protein
MEVDDDFVVVVTDAEFVALLLVPWSPPMVAVLASPCALFPSTLPQLPQLARNTRKARSPPLCLVSAVP